jgi:tetratricopeptide (TPR) repeat protein
MTPDYASPEQVRGEPETTSSDIYSLGLILYEILAGARGQKLESYSTAEIYQVICSQQPPSPSAVAPAALRKTLRGDLDAIVAAAIHKDVGRRYTSVEQLSDDIDRYLAGRAVRAHKDSLAYRGKKFVRRHVWPVTSAALLLAVLVGGIAATRRQAQRAERRFEELRTVSNRFLFEFHDEVAKLPGSTAARELIVRTALEFLGSLSRESTDPALLTEVAVAYARVGDAQGRPNQPNLGRLADAAASYEKSIGILSSLRARGKADLAGRRALVSYLGRLSSLYQNAGDREASKSAAERALAFSRDLPPGGPQDEELMGMAEVAIGDIGMASDQAQTALDHYRAGLAHRTRASDGSAPRLRSLAVAYERVGTALHLLGDLQGALEAHSKQENVYHEMLQRTPPDPRARRGMMVACQFLGNIIGATNEPSLGDPKRALEYYRRMLDLALQAHVADPKDIEAKTDVIRSYLKIADVVDTGASIVQLRQALALAETLPEGPQQHSLLVSTWRYLAERFLHQGDLAAAAHALGRAEDFMGRRLTSVASNSAPDERRAAVKASRGELLLQRGDVEGALRNFTETLAFYQSRHEAAINALEPTWDLSCALDRMARATARDSARSRGYRQRQVTLWRDWNGKFVRSSFSERQLGEAERLWAAAQ